MAKDKSNYKEAMSAVAGISNVSINQVNLGTDINVVDVYGRHAIEHATRILKQSSSFNNAKYHLPTSSKKTQAKLDSNNFYKIIQDDDQMAIVQGLLSSNQNYRQNARDYKMLQRCYPQIAKFIKDIVVNILSPDSITNNYWQNTIRTSGQSEEVKLINNLIETYDLNSFIFEVVEDYITIGRYCNQIIPTSKLLNLLKELNKENITEAANDTEERLILEDALDKLIGYNDNTYFLSETVSDVHSITESVHCDFITDAEKHKTGNKNKAPSALDIQKATKSILETIEYVDGAMAYARDDILTEAAIDQLPRDKSVKNIYKQLRNKNNPGESASEGLSEGDVEKIEKEVKFKGAIMNKLDPGRLQAFKIRGKLVCYYYVEQLKTNSNVRSSVSSIRQQIDSQLYGTDGGTNTNVKDALTKNIGDAIIAQMSPSFLNANMDDIEVIYSFVKDMELDRGGKRVVCFHPDEVTVYERPGGSILVNAMFSAKLYLLTIITNTLANVTRGTDRNVFGVKTGLDTDIKGHVTNAIRAMKQNNLRYSNVDTINKIFNVVGSMVDVFLPISIDGERPVEIETISGQDIDMNTDFLAYLNRSVIVAMGFPPSMVDIMEEVERVKTLSMVSKDVARTVSMEQIVINKGMTADIRKLIDIELIDSKVDSMMVTAGLTPPSALREEMMSDKVDMIVGVAETLADVYMEPADEAPKEKARREFIKEYIKKYGNDGEVLERLSEIANILSKKPGTDNKDTNSEEESSDTTW